MKTKTHNNFIVSASESTFGKKIITKLVSLFIYVFTLQLSVLVQTFVETKTFTIYLFSTGNNNKVAEL